MVVEERFSEEGKGNGMGTTYVPAGTPEKGDPTTETADAELEGCVDV